MKIGMIFEKLPKKKTNKNGALIKNMILILKTNVTSLSRTPKRVTQKMLLHNLFVHVFENVFITE